jgi:hypothetical protein
MSFKSSIYSLLSANRNEGARMSKGTSSLIVGLVALVLVVATLVVAVSIIGTGTAKLTPPNGDLARSLAPASQSIGEAFPRSVALIDQSPVGYVATTGPVIGQSVFPGEALARNLALTSQPIGEAFARSVALIDPTVP